MARADSKRIVDYIDSSLADLEDKSALDCELLQEQQTKLDTELRDVERLEMLQHERERALLGRIEREYEELRRIEEAEEQLDKEIAMRAAVCSQRRAELEHAVTAAAERRRKREEERAERRRQRLENIKAIEAMERADSESFATERARLLAELRDLQAREEEEEKSEAEELRMHISEIHTREGALESWLRRRADLFESERQTRNELWRQERLALESSAETRKRKQEELKQRAARVEAALAPSRSALSRKSVVAAQERRNAAATRIQALWRGFVARALFHNRQQARRQLNDPKYQRWRREQLDEYHQGGDGSEFEGSLARYLILLRLDLLQKEEKTLQQQLDKTETNLLLHTLQRVRQEKEVFIKKLAQLESGSATLEEILQVHLPPDPFLTVSQQEPLAREGSGVAVMPKVLAPRRKKPNRNAAPFDLTERLSAVLEQKELARGEREPQVRTASAARLKGAHGPAAKPGSAASGHGEAARLPKLSTTNGRAESAPPTMSKSTIPPLESASVTLSVLSRGPASPTNLSTTNTRSATSANSSSRRKIPRAPTVTNNVGAPTAEALHTKQLRQQVWGHKLVRHPAAPVLELYGLSATTFDPFKL